MDFPALSITAPVPRTVSEVMLSRMGGADVSGLDEIEAELRQHLSTVTPSQPLLERSTGSVTPTRDRPLSRAMRDDRRSVSGSRAGVPLPMDLRVLYGSSELELPMRRSFSYAHLESESKNHAALVQLTARLVENLRRTESRLAYVEKRLSVVLEETTRWFVRYTRRISVVSNLLLGVWVFVSRIINYVTHKYRMRTVLGDIFLPSGLKKRAAGRQLNALLFEGYVHAVAPATVLVFAAFCISRRDRWKNDFGLLTASGCSAYLMYADKDTKYPNFAALAANCLFILMRLSSSPAVVDYLRHAVAMPPPPPELAAHAETPSMAQLNATVPRVDTREFPPSVPATPRRED